MKKLPLKRISAVLLVMIMTLSLLPISAVAGSENFATYIKISPSGTDSVRVDWMLKTGTETSNGGMINFAYDSNVFELQKGASAAIITATGNTNITDCLMDVPASIPIAAALANMEETPGMVLVNMQFATMMTPIQFTSDTPIGSLILKLKFGYTQSTIPMNALRLATPSESGFAGTSVASISNPSETDPYSVGLTGTGTEDAGLAATLRVEAGTGITFVKTLTGISISGNSTVTVPTAVASSATVNLTATASYDSGPTEDATNNAAWSIVEGVVAGVTVTNGVVTITKDAVAGEINIKAVYGNKEATHKITISKTAPIATTIAIYADSACTIEAGANKSIPIPATGNTSETYYATICDQYGETIAETPVWSTTSLPAGVTHSNGSVTIASTATAGSFVITATSASESTVKSTITINVTSKSPHTVSDFAETVISVIYGDSITGQTVTCLTGTPTYTSSNDSIVAVNTTTGALTVKKAGGPVTITATVAEDTDYSEVTKSYSVTVSKRELSITGLLATNRDYDGTTTIALTGGTLTNKVTSDDVQITMPTTGTVADADVGSNKTVTISAPTLTGSAAENYTLAALPAITVNISKATPAGVPEYTKITASGKTLADADLKVGTILPTGGTIAWDMATSTTATANTAYNWTYTPADAANYDVLTGTITPYETSGSGSGGNSGTTTENAISPSNAAFDKKAGEVNNKDIVITLTTVNAALSSIKNGNTTLVEGTDYTKNVSTYTIKKEYLATLPIGTQTLVFDMSTGTDPALTITITETATDDWKNPFIDVKAEDWFYGDLEYVHRNGLYTGTTANTFSPNNPMTRGMIVTVLGRLAGIKEADYSRISFSDVNTTQYYAPYIKWASENGIVNGIGNNKFHPDGNISRQDLATILMRYTQFVNATLPNTTAKIDFKDSKDIAAYAASAVDTIQRAGIINGKPGEIFDPLGNATRAEVAAMLHRFTDAIK